MVATCHHYLFVFDLILLLSHFEVVPQSLHCWVLKRTFFAQSVRVKLASPQAAQISIHFSRKISRDAPL